MKCKYFQSHSCHYREFSLQSRVLLHAFIFQEMYFTNHLEHKAYECIHFPRKYTSQIIWNIKIVNHDTYIVLMKELD